MKANTSKTAILVSGTYRETEFLFDVFPTITQGLDHDIFVVLRHTAGEKSRLGQIEPDFKLPNVDMENVFLCELPSVDKDEIHRQYLIPVGPTDEDRECAILGMFQGVFMAISMMKASLRHYDYVLKTRTDYLPPYSLPEMISTVNETGKILVDGCANWYNRYSDRLDILWHGSLNDILCFAPYQDFLKVWDFSDLLVKCWTGIPETTLFRASMYRIMGDDIQSPRRNDSFLKKYFIWDMNDTKQSFHVLRRRQELPKKGEATYFKGGEVVKYFSDKNKVKGRVERAKLLEGIVPKIKYSTDNYYAYDFVEGTLLSESDTETFKKFLSFMKGRVWNPMGAVNPEWYDACREFYYDKTLIRLRDFYDQTRILDKKETINGEKVPSAYDLTESIDWNWLCDGIPACIHGDPQPENVLVTKDGFCLLDWREDFAGLPYGDVYYDLAKIYHALLVSGQVIRDEGYSITEGDSIKYTLSYKNNLIEFKDILEKFIIDNGYNLPKVRILSALIYLNIAALHQEPYNRFLFYFGRHYLYELIARDMVK